MKLWLFDHVQEEFVFSKIAIIGGLTTLLKNIQVIHTVVKKSS